MLITLFKDAISTVLVL